MYSVPIDCHTIMFALVFSSILYGAQLFVIWTNQTIILGEIINIWAFSRLSSLHIANINYNKNCINILFSS